MPKLNEYALIADDIIERCRKLGEAQPDRIGVGQYVHTETKLVPKVIRRADVRRWDGKVDIADWVCTTERQTKDTPACIMGQALVELGVEPHQLRQNMSISAMLQLMGIEATDQEKTWLLNCQPWHDQGKTWAEAVRLADRGVVPYQPPNPIAKELFDKLPKFTNIPAA